jgi:hypothetical protein
VAREQTGRRLADAALARDESDLAAAGDRRLDPRNELAMVELSRARPDVNDATG